MKMLLFNNALNERGGAERVMLKIAQHYRAPVYVHRYDQSGTFPEFNEVDVRVIGKRSARSGKAAAAIRYGTSFYNMKVHDDYDLINAHMSPSEWIRNRNPRVLWYCHTPPRIVYEDSISKLKRRSLGARIAYAPLSFAYKRIENGIVARLEGIAANSANTQSRIHRYLNAESEVINPCIDPKGFKDAGDDRFFLYPSRIAEEKRQDYAIRAFKRFAEKRKGYKLVIAGSLSSRHEEFRRYYNKIKSGAGRDVKFITNPEDHELKELYSKCTAVLYPPINEDFGIVPLEAMASRKPVIAVNEGGPKETIRDGETGFLVESEQDMAEHMLYIVRHGQEAEAMGRTARRTIEKEYTWDRFFNKFDRLAREVAKSEAKSKNKA